MTCLARVIPARHRLSECSRQQCLRVLTVLESPVPLRPRRITEFSRGIQSERVQEAHHESTGSSSTTLLRREELIPDSMRKTTLANLDTKTLKAFRNIFAHHKNAHAKISDWLFYIPVELHTQVRARIRSVIDPKTDEKRFTAVQVDNWQNIEVLTVLKF